MSNLSKQHAEQYFLQQFRLTLDTLLTPISTGNPAGDSLRNTAIYSAIKKARHQDDPSVPMGAWEHELKYADWSEVSALCLQGLQQSKDIQLAAWLLEAQIHQRGLAGIAPCLILIQQLCLVFWPTIYPLAEDGDIEHRANIIRWAAEKLLPALNLTPLIEDGEQGVYSWSHWEQAQRNEQRRVNSNTRNPPPIEGVSLQELNIRISATATEHFAALQQNVQEALQAITELSLTLDQLCGEAAPSMGSMVKLLTHMLSFIESELFKRGALEPKTAASENNEVEPKVEANMTNILDLNSHEAPIKKATRTRAEAYATLAETAEFLIQLEPHSPVPYLVKRATEWGGLNTVELYQELFLRLNGQLNIFEMLGLEQEVRA